VSLKSGKVLSRRI